MTGAGPDLEVVVVNDGGPAPSDVLVERLRGRLDLVIVAQPRRGPAAARNSASARSRDACVGYVGGSCGPAPH